MEKVYATDYTAREMMIVSAARQNKDGDVVLVGVGLPMLAASLAKRMFAPNLTMLFETGVIDGNLQDRLPKAVGDPSIVKGATGLIGLYDIFALYLGGGFVDTGFLGAAQIDRFGNINTTVIGDYSKPKVRLPGSGGACDIASLAKKLIVIMPHNKRNFAEKVDFITSVGYLDGKNGREKAGLKPGGPKTLITEKGIFGFDNDNCEMELISYHPGTMVEEIQASIPWKLRISPDIKETEPPTVEEIRVLREEIKA